MKAQITALMFALTADKIARAETLPNGDDMVDPEGCEDLTFFVEQGCCHLYTEAHFQG